MGANKMDDTEQQIRIAVANDFANRARDVYSSNPGIAAALKQEVYTSILPSLDKLVQSGEMNHKDVREIQTAISEGVDYGFSTDIAVQEVADTWMKSKGNHEYYFGIFINAFKKETKGNLPDGFQSKYDILLQYAGRRDNIINTLVCKVKEKGIQSITNVHIRNAVTKEFSNAEDYIQSKRKMVDAIGCMTSLVMQSEGGKHAEFYAKLVKIMIDKNMDMQEKTALKADVEVLYKR